MTKSRLPQSLPLPCLWGCYRLPVFPLCLWTRLGVVWSYIMTSLRHKIKHTSKIKLLKGFAQADMDIGHVWDVGNMMIWAWGNFYIYWLIPNSSTVLECFLWTFATCSLGLVHQLTVLKIQWSSPVLKKIILNTSCKISMPALKRMKKKVLPQYSCSETLALSSGPRVCWNSTALYCPRERRTCMVREKLHNFWKSPKPQGILVAWITNQRPLRCSV